MRRLVLCLILLSPAAFANQRVTIFCMQGGHFVVTNGVPSVTQVQQSYPVCSMTVYPAGSNTPVAGNMIFSDNVGTVKGNPFNADQTGVGFFYAANGRYDVVISGGQGGGLPAPYTIGDILLQDNAAGGTVTSVTGSSGVSCNTVAGAVTCTNSGVLSNVAGSGIGVSGATGNVTITNNGVTSFNSRTGVVSPQSADYTWSQIGGSKQGNTNVPQMAGANSGVLGATLCDDAAGNATTTGCSGGGGGGSSGYILVSSVNFSQNPSGTLTASTPATVTLTPCPTGVSGTDAHHYYYISGTGTPEAVLGTGGSCVSGAGSGTLQFTPANNHTAGYALSSASGGLQECFNDGVILGAPFGCVLTTNITEYADVFAPTISNWELLGIGQPTISMSGAGVVQTACGGASCRNGIIIPGPTQSGVTTNVTMGYGSFANRQNTFTNSFVVSSATGITQNGFLRLEWDAQEPYFGGMETYEFDQIVKVGAVSGTTITPYESVKIPLAAANFTGTPGVTVLTMESNVKISGITFDGSALTGGGWQSCILYYYLRNSLISDITCRNTTQYGITGTFGYRNQFSNLRFDTAATNAQGGPLIIFRESYGTVNNLTMINSPFGINLVYPVEWQVNNINSSIGQQNAGRGCKFVGAVYVQVNNADCSDGPNNADTGFSIQGGTYRMQATNITANNWAGGAAAAGIHFDGESNTWNVIQNATAYGNTNDYAFGATDSFNVINGFSGLTTSDQGTNNEVSWAYRERGLATNSAPQSTTSGVSFYLSWDTNGDPNTGAMHSTSVNPTRFTASVPGYYRAICSAEFASNATGYRALLIQKNHSGASNLQASQFPAATGLATVVQLILPPSFLAATDFIECIATQNSGGNLNVDSVNSSFYVERAY